MFAIVDDKTNQEVDRNGVGEETVPLQEGEITQSEEMVTECILPSDILSKKVVQLSGAQSPAVLGRIRKPKS